MYKVSGRIISAQRGTGIGNISVVLYDLDPRAPDRDTRVTRVQSRQSKNLWAEIPGQRIGSVISARDGTFSIAFEAGAFVTGDHDGRPDLLLLLLAPEEAQLTDGSIAVCVPPAERLLYCSCNVVMGAGSSESFLIKLPDALLQRHGIDAFSGAHLMSARQRIETTGHEDTEIQHAIETTALARTRALARPILTRRAQIEHAFADFSLSKRSVESRPEHTYVPPKAPVLPVQAALVDAQLATIAQKSELAPRKLRLQVSEDDLARWGVSAPAGEGSFSLDVPARSVFDRLKQQVRFGSLDRTRSWLEIACSELQAEDRLQEMIGRCSRAVGTDEGDDAAATPPNEVFTREALLRRLDAQLRHQTAPEIQLQYGVEREGEITATITRPSPADVTRYHDFHDLQIAFEHVWTEAVDEGLPGLFKELYGQMIRFQNRVSGEATARPVRSLEDMLSLYEEFRSLKEAMEAEDEPVPEPPRPVDANVRAAYPDVTPELWAAATPQEKQQLRDLAARHASLHDYDFGDGFLDIISMGGNAGWRDLQKAKNRRSAQNLVTMLRQRVRRRDRGSTGAPAIGTRARAPRTRLEQLFREIDTRLAEPYSFDIFAPGSVNYGIMLTYRQKWVPLDYQVGSLVSTIPLAPKETRQYSTKHVVRRTRAEKRLEEREDASRRERSSTARADAEIVRQARDKTSFEQTANGTVELGVFKGEFGTRFGVEAEKSSAQTKKNFRESVLKAADEFKQKHTLEVTTSHSEEIQTETSGTITNPNDEITVTYLFYELQRQYEISERLQRLTPVVLVASKVPRPDEVDEDWLLTHQWILERVLLDESLRPAMLYLTNGLAGDQLALEALRDAVDRQIDLVEEITKQVATKTRLAEEAFEELRALLSDPERGERLKDIGLALAFGPLGLLGSGGDDEAAEKREEIAKLALERADQATQEVSARLTREVTALTASIDKYVAALQQHFDHQLAIAKLRLHVKQNILYYMHAIWDHEPTDQRYFRLYNIEVPWVEENELSVSIRAEGLRLEDGARRPMWNLSVPLPIAPLGGARPYRRTTRRLHQIADLDNLLGYKGNYMIFPAREHSFLHLYMMQDYLDANGGIRDPDGPGYSTRELLDYVCCLQKHAPQRLEAEREQLLDMIKERLTSPKPESELVVIPTDSLFIEALPGRHPVMEQFKVVHRALDVKKVQGEVRELELENLRLAARLLAGEHDDPTIDRLVRVEGEADVDVDVGP